MRRLKEPCFITVEFRPEGAFPIFGVPMPETSNQLWETECVFGQWSREVQATVNEAFVSVRYCSLPVEECVFNTADRIPQWAVCAVFNR
jgi:hypothetical protein